MSSQDKPAKGALQIVVLGAGSIGSAFAFELARKGGHQVTAVARPGSVRFQQLTRDGGIVNDRGERVELRVSDRLDEQAPYDLVLVTVLAHQVDAVLPALQRCRARTILLMFNNFEPERLRDALGAERCCFGMPFIQARLDGEGKLSAKIGAGGQKSKLGQKAWVEIFASAGLPSVFEPEMLLWLRCHVPMAAAFESVSVAGVSRGGGASWAEAMVVARGAQEGFTLIQRLGYRLYPSTKAFLRANPTWVLASILWSVSRIPSFRELLATGLQECHALVDAMLVGASGRGIAVRVDLIAAMTPRSQVNRKT